MTTFAGGTVSDGQVASSLGAIYTSTGLVTYIKSVTFGNTSATQQTLLLYVTRSGSTARLVRQFVLAQYETASWPDGESYELSSGDALEAVTTTGSVVDYTVTGVTAS